jgi:ABC-type multidrug transport system permease subunit
MKIGKIIRKNLKLLLRSKITAVVVLLAPLLIIGLVGFAFNNNALSQLNIAIYTPDNSGLTPEFVAQLKENKFDVTNSVSQEECIDAVRQGTAHTCIVFPPEFLVEKNQTKEIVFYADYSRTNFVNSIINTILSNLNVQTSEVSKDLTTKILTTLDEVQKTNQDLLLTVAKMKASADSVQKRLEGISESLNRLDFSGGNLDISSLSDDLSAMQDSISNLHTIGTSMKTRSDQFFTYVDANTNISTGNGSTYASIQAALNNDAQNFHSKYNDTKDTLDALISKADNTSSEVDLIKQKLDSAGKFKTNTTAQIANIKKELDAVRASLTDMKATLEKLNDKIGNIEIRNAEKIVNPITTRVEPLQAQSTNLNYMFPYLIILIIMFVSLLLSSTLVVLEKRSRAYFRNFTTPTSDFLFIIANYLTNIFVMLVQVVIILGIAYFFLNTKLFNDIEITILVLILTVLLFVALGLCIGYLFTSQEAAIMVSVAVGCVFLFVSNIILPIESMPLYIQQIALFNPYVILSELLKKVMLFGIDMAEYGRQFGMILAYIALFVSLIFIIQKLSKIRYLSHKPAQRKAQAAEILHRSVADMELKNLDSPEKLLEFIRTISDAEFKNFVNRDINAFAVFARKNVQDKEIQQILTKQKDKKHLIYYLEQHTKKKHKHKSN